MNGKSIHSLVLETLNEKGTIANGHVVQTLMGKANVKGTTGEKLIHDELASLQGTGHVTIVRGAEGQIDRVSLNPTNKRRPLEKRIFGDRTELSAGAKSVMMFAKGVPSRLTDDQCSPVVVTTIEEREKKAIATPNNMPAKITLANSADEAKATPAPMVRDLLEWVNLGLTGLQCLADPETGKLPIGSVHDYLMEELKRYNITASRATQVNQLLARLGLRTTVNLGFAPKVDDEPRMPRFQSTVVMTVTKVTQAMLDEVLSSAGLSDEATDEVEVSENPAVEAEAEESEVEIEVTSPSAKMAELAKVLKHLDGQIEILGAAGKAKDAEITRLQLELRTVQQQNGELERELAELRAAPIDPETASILDKYRDIK